MVCVGVLKGYRVCVWEVERKLVGLEGRKEGK